MMGLSGGSSERHPAQTEEKSAYFACFACFTRGKGPLADIMFGSASV